LQQIALKKRVKSIVTKNKFVKTLACFAFEKKRKTHTIFYNSGTDFPKKFIKKINVLCAKIV